MLYTRRNYAILLEELCYILGGMMQYYRKNDFELSMCVRS